MDGRRCRFSLTVALACLLLTPMLAVGCAQPVSPEVRELLSEAKSHYDKSIAAVKEVADNQKRLSELATAEQTPEVVATERALILGARSADQEALSEVKKTEAALAQIRSKNVSKEMNTYVNLRTGTLRQQEKLVQLDLKILDLGDQVLSQTASNAPLDQRLATAMQIQELNRQSQKQNAEVQALNSDAAQYYADKKLGK